MSDYKQLAAKMSDRDMHPVFERLRRFVNTLEQEHTADRPIRKDGLIESSNDSPNTGPPPNEGCSVCGCTRCDWHARELAALRKYEHELTAAAERLTKLLDYKGIGLLEVDAAVEVLGKERDELRQQVETMTIERDGLRSRVQTLTNCRVDSCYDERTRIKADYDTMRHTKERLQAEVAELRTTNESLHKMVESLEQNMRFWQARANDFDTQLAARRGLTDEQVKRAKELANHADLKWHHSFTLEWARSVESFLRSLVEQETQG